MRIVVIDDDEGVRDSLKLHLEEHGHSVTASSEPLLCDRYHGFDCHAEQSCADVLLVGYHMPVMTGLEFMKLLSQRGCKSHSAHKIIMSGNAGEIDLASVHRIGCHVLQKPFSLERLDTILSRLRA